MEKEIAQICCDICNKPFPVEYDPDTETEDDAAFMASCFHCGLVLCTKCGLLHNCEEYDYEN